MMLRCYSSAVAGRYCMVTGSSAIRRISGTNAKTIRKFSSSWNWSPSQDKITSAAGITTVASPVQVNSNIQTEVLDQCARLHSSSMPLNNQLEREQQNSCDKMAAMGRFNPNDMMEDEVDDRTTLKEEEEADKSYDTHVEATFESNSGDASGWYLDHMATFHEHTTAQAGEGYYSFPAAFSAPLHRSIL